MSPHPIPDPSTILKAPVQAPPLMEQFRLAARARGDAAPTVDVLASWARAYILFHDKKHPATLGLPDSGTGAVKVPRTG